MTTLAAYPLTDGQMDLFADSTPLGKLHAADFEEACRAVADVDGWVNPNLVNAWLHAKWGEVDMQWYSGQWAPACGPRGFMDKTSVEVPIDGRFSKNNANKGVKLRRLRT